MERLWTEWRILSKMVINHLLESRRAAQVVYRKNKDGEYEILLVRAIAPGYDSGYVLPKGKLEVGESSKDAAEREIREETGLRTKIIKPLTPQYSTSDILGHGLIHCYLGEYVGGPLSMSGETVDNGGDLDKKENDISRFFLIKDAKTLVTNPLMLGFIRQAEDYLKNVPSSRN